MKTFIIIFESVICCLMTSCIDSEYLNKPEGSYSFHMVEYGDKLYTKVIVSNNEYSEEKFGHEKKEQDSLFEEWMNAHPGKALSKTMSGYFRVKGMRKELGIMVLFLDILKDDPFRDKMVISLADKSYYRGEKLKVGEVYFFELSPLYPVSVYPPVLGQSFGIDPIEKVLLENHWIELIRDCGNNVYTSSNLNGDKYIKSAQKK